MVRKANSSTKPPIQIGEPNRPGQIEGANVDPVIIAGEIEVKKLNILRPADIIKAVAYRQETNEAVIIADEHSAFTYVERGVAPPAWNADSGYSFNQSKILYYNGNSIVNVSDIIREALPGDEAVYLRHYKLNQAAWRPVIQPSPVLERQHELERLGMEGNLLEDFCLLVGEQKNIIDETGAGPKGALMMLFPALLGAARNINAPGVSPIQVPTWRAWENDPAGSPDMDNVELFACCWKTRIFPDSTIHDRYRPNMTSTYATNVAYVVGTRRVGTNYVPQVYQVIFLSAMAGPGGVPVAYFNDLSIGDIFSNGIITGCDYDDEEEKLYIVGTPFDGQRQIYAVYDERTETWTDRSGDLKENFIVLQEGDDGYLIQDAHGIRLISNSSAFIANGVKRGTALWVDITAWNSLAQPDNTYAFNAMQSGIFFVQRVASQTELILDKRMPNKYAEQDNGVGVPFRAINSLFRYGFLNTTISDTDNAIIVDVPENMVEDGGVIGVTFPAIGGLVYINGEQILYQSSAFVDVVDPCGNYRRYTLTNCGRGANGTMPTGHIANIIGIGGGIEVCDGIRTVVVLCEARDFKAFTKLTDCKLDLDNSSVFITGDNALMVRHDISIDMFVDFREKISIPSMDFGRMDWKPNANAAMVVANTTMQSYVYMFDRGYLRRMTVPTSGIINDISWSADGLSGLIAGKFLHKMTKKVIVEMAEREPRTIPVRYLFNDVGFTRPGLDAAGEDIPIDIISSDALNIDDLDSETLEMFIRLQYNVQLFSEQEPDYPHWWMFDFELRIYLSGRGDEMHSKQRYFWRSYNLTDVNIDDSASHFGWNSTYVEEMGMEKIAYWTIKLPRWAKYVAVDFVNRLRYAAPAGTGLTIGIQGGVK